MELLTIEIIEPKVIAILKTMELGLIKTIKNDSSYSVENSI
ncbi:MAG TPA: hypothetical protein VF273_00010 [Pelobium sp.]